MDSNTADNSPISVSYLYLVSIKKFYDFRFFFLSDLSLFLIQVSCHPWADCTNTLFWYFWVLFSCFVYWVPCVIGVGHKFFQCHFLIIGTPSISSLIVTVRCMQAFLAPYGPLISVGILVNTILLYLLQLYKNLG